MKPSDGKRGERQDHANRQSGNPIHRYRHESKHRERTRHRRNELPLEAVPVVGELLHVVSHECNVRPGARRWRHVFGAPPKRLQQPGAHARLRSPWATQPQIGRQHRRCGVPARPYHHDGRGVVGVDKQATTHRPQRPEQVARHECDSNSPREGLSNAVCQRPVKRLAGWTVRMRWLLGDRLDHGYLPLVRIFVDRGDDLLKSHRGVEARYAGRLGLRHDVNPVVLDRRNLGHCGVVQEFLEGCTSLTLEILEEEDIRVGLYQLLGIDGARGLQPDRPRCS